MPGRKRTQERLLTLTLWLVSIAAAATLISTQMPSDFAPDTSRGKVLERSGNVQVRREKIQNWKSLEVNAPIHGGTSVITSQNSSATLAFENSTIQLEQNTLIQIPHTREQSDINFDSGSFTAQSGDSQDIRLKVGGKLVNLRSTEPGTFKISRSDEGATEISSLRGEMKIDIDGHSQTLNEKNTLNFSWTETTSDYNEEQLATVRAASPNEITEMKSAEFEDAAVRHIAESKPVEFPVASDAQQPPTKDPGVNLPTQEQVSLSKPAGTFDPFAFQFGIGTNYLLAEDSSRYSGSQLQGFSGPIVYLQAWKSLTETLGMDLSYQATNSKIHASLYGQDSTAVLDWNTASAGLYLKTDVGIPLVSFGLNWQDFPLLHETDKTILIEKAKIFSGYLGYGQSVLLREDLFILWQMRILLPVTSESSKGLSDFRPGLGYEANIGAYKCVSKNWGIGIHLNGQTQPARYRAAYDSSGTSTAYSASMTNATQQLRIFYGACGGRE